jgi:DNA-binding transcriptional LysR family regulator
LSVHLQQSLSQAAMEGVRRGELDCAYVLSTLAGDDALDVQRLAPVRIVPLLPSRWQDEGLPAGNVDLAHKPWVGLAPNCGLRSHFEAFFREAGVEPRVSARADSEAAIRGLVASGLGAGLVREDQARDAERLGEGRIWNGWQSTAWICWVAAAPQRQSPAVRALRDVVLETWR